MREAAAERSSYMVIPWNNHTTMHKHLGIGDCGNWFAHSISARILTFLHRITLTDCLHRTA
jgi:hypothetical protein